MGGVLLFLIMAVIVGGIIWFLRRRVLRLNRVLEPLCEEYGLEFSAGHGLWLPSAKGTVAGIALTVSERGLLIGASMEFRFTWERSFPARIQIVKPLYPGADQQLAEQRMSQQNVSDLHSSLHCFADSEVHLQALMDVRLRKNLTTLAEVAGVVRLESSLLVVAIGQGRLKKRSQLAKLVECGLAVGHLVQTFPAVLSKLERKALDDPDMFARQNAVYILGLHFLEQPGVRATLRKTLKDESYWIQLTAAARLGVEGVRHACTLLPRLEKLDDVDQDNLAGILIGADDTNLTDSKWKLFQKARAPKLRLKLLAHFRELGDQALSQRLCAVLEDTDRDMQLAAAAALETCGSLEAVEPLYHLEKSSFSRRLDEAARQAMAAIQSRHGGGDKGWLTMSRLKEQEGGLSKPSAAGGELSKGRKQGKRKQV